MKLLLLLFWHYTLCFYLYILSAPAAPFSYAAAKSHAMDSRDDNCCFTAVRDPD